MVSDGTRNYRIQDTTDAQEFRVLFTIKLFLLWRPLTLPFKAGVGRVREDHARRIDLSQQRGWATVFLLIYW